MKDTCDSQGADEIHKVGVKLKDETRRTNVIDGRENALKYQSPRQSVTKGIIVIQRVA